MRLFPSLCLLSLIPLGSSLTGCANAPGEEVPSAAPEEVGAASEALTDARRNELQCALWSAITPGLSEETEQQSFYQGCLLFFNETFGGNGRTCATCHLGRLGNGNPDDNNLDLSIEDVEAAFADDPGGPLFRELDSDDGRSAAEGGVDGDFGILRRMADVRIPLALHSNVVLMEDGLPSPTRTVTAWRSTPTSENTVFFEGQRGTMWDARFATLEIQGPEAVLTHYQTHLFPGGRLPTAEEAGDIATFQRHRFSNRRLRRYADGGPPPSLPTVASWLAGDYWDSVRRGRAFFVDDGQAAVDAGHRDLCATCHSGPLLNQTSSSNPVQPAGEFFSNNFVSELHVLRPADRQLPVHSYAITLDHWVTMPDVYIAQSPFLPPPGAPLIPPGVVFEIRDSPDPGRVLLTGDPCELAASCIIQCSPTSPFCGTTSVFRISTLWGAADSGPYFHDNSAHTIHDVMVQAYIPLFAATADGLNALALDGEPFRLSAQDVEDIENAFDYLFRRDLL